MEQVTVAGQAAPSVGTTQAPAGPAQDRASPEQLSELRRLMRQAGADEGIAELEASRFDPACQALRRKLGKGGAG